MISHHQNGCDCESKNVTTVAPAFTLGQSLGALFFTSTQILVGGVRMVRGFVMPRDCDCPRCVPRSCDCVQCLPPVYAGCCRNCGE
jgi:hypothetical protein